MINIGDKVDNTAGASGELSADEYNDHKNEIQESVERTGQALNILKTPEQLGRAMFINGTSAQSFQDTGTVDQIVLTPFTGISGLITPDDYSQMDGMIVIFDKTTANTSTSVTINIGQTTGTLLGAKNLNSAPIGLIGQIMIRYNLGSDYWELVQIQSMPEIGYIQTELVISGTNLLIKKPKITVEPTIGFRKLINNTVDTTIDITGLTASTWYALCCREDNGAVSAQAISAFASGSGGNWDILGNQLDMYDEIWDSDRKYCRAYDGTNYYRVFGVGIVNAGSTDFSYMFYIPNIPYTKVEVKASAVIPVTAVGAIINYDVINYDINSEYSAGSVTTKPEQNINAFAQTFGLMSANYVFYQLFLTGLGPQIVNEKYMNSFNNTTYVLLSSSGHAKNGSVIIISHAADANYNVGASLNYFRVTGSM